MVYQGKRGLVGSGRAKRLAFGTTARRGLLSNSGLINSTPTIPTELNAVGLTGSVTLTWDAVLGAITYNIRRSPTGTGTWVTPTGGTGVATNSFTDTDAPVETDDYEVQAVNNAGTSDWSSIATASAWLAATNFPQANGTSLSGASLEVTVSSAVWVQQAGIWTVQSNNANQGQNNTTGVLTLDAGTPNVTAYLTCAVPTPPFFFAGIVLKYVDAENLIYVAVRNADDASRVDLIEVISNSQFQRINTVISAPGTTTIKVVLSGANAELFVDGSSVGAYSPLNNNPTNLHGLVMFRDISYQQTPLGQFRLSTP